MTRFERRYSTELQITIWMSIVIVFIVDLRTAAGIAVWVFYVVPLILSSAGWKPAMPLIVSAVVTTLTLAGLIVEQAGAPLTMATTNRLFGVVTFWAMAIIGRQFVKTKLTVMEQNWLREGQSRLAAEIQGEQLLPAFGEKALRFLVRYLEAQVGVIHVRSGDTTFHRVASHAALLTESVVTLQPGEGLTGQVLRDRRAIVVNDLPDDYIRIESGLGAAKPRHLIVSPGIAEGEVEAVIELGFLNALQQSDIKLLESIAVQIGMAIRASKYRTRLEYLLEETQRQAEQLQAQTEELRVSNEELEEQGRMLRDSQARLEAQQAELEETNAQLEEQAQRLESQKMDLTRAKGELAERAQELARASQYKSEFLANMSHELRTPLNSSLILAKLLADNKAGTLSSEEVKYAQTIYSAGNDLLDLVNDILDLSKIEAGEVRVQPDTVRISRLVEGLQRTFEPLSAVKKLHFSVDAAREAPATIVTDVQRLEQILKNLLSNAFKFTEKGGVTLHISPAVEDRISFAVRDTGIGIPKEQQEVIFEAFRQADGSTHRKFGGTGLGLSISQRLAALLGGEIHVESAPGHGSTFTLLLPRTFSAEQVQHAVVASAASATAGLSALPPLVERELPPAPDVPSHQVDDDRNALKPGARTLLVIEDDEPFARILYDVAREAGFQCVISLTAADGLAMARECQPNAVVLDMQLPDQSGLYVLDRLKRNPATRHIPVHVVSVADYTQTARELGAVSYAMKPVNRDDLAAALRNLEAKLDQPVRRILVIEDDDRQRESIQRLLEGPDVELTAVASAKETLEKLKETKFDCVVMDLGLKDMSGYELLDRMAAQQAYSFPPVIIYTGRVLEPMDEQQLRRYSQSIIIKGARSPERLLDEVTLFLHQVESKLPDDRQQMLRLVRDRDSMLEGRRILVVEDDVRNIFALTSVLEPKGAKIEIARTGKQAIEALERTSNGDRIDLVLMDLMMPEMDGLTAIRHIRKRPEFLKLPIIALTAKAMPDDRDQSIAAGANDYISKPLDVDRLLSLIRVWMPKA